MDRIRHTPIPIHPELRFRDLSGRYPDIRAGVWPFHYTLRTNDAL
jgi:hypothetical protein